MRQILMQHRPDGNRLQCRPRAAGPLIKHHQAFRALFKPHSGGPSSAPTSTPACEPLSRWRQNAADLGSSRAPGSACPPLRHRPRQPSFPRQARHGMLLVSIGANVIEPVEIGNALRIGPWLPISFSVAAMQKADMRIARSTNFTNRVPSPSAARHAQQGAEAEN